MSRTIRAKRITFTIPQSDQDKVWVRIDFENGQSWFPSFVDIADLVSKIGKCEDVKYPNGEGYRMTQRFMYNCFNKSRSEIIKMYQDRFNPNNKYFSK